MSDDESGYMCAECLTIECDRCGKPIELDEDYTPDEGETRVHWDCLTATEAVKAFNDEQNQFMYIVLCRWNGENTWHVMENQLPERAGAVKIGEIAEQELRQAISNDIEPDEFYEVYITDIIEIDVIHRTSYSLQYTATLESTEEDYE